MFKILKRPYQLLLLTAVLILISSFFMYSQPLDMHLHDTFYVMSISSLLWMIIIILLLFWTIYYSTTHLLFSKALTWAHIILLVISSIFLVVILFYSNYQGLAGAPRQYYDFNSLETVEQMHGLALGLVTLVAAILLGLFMYLINLIIGLNKRYSTSRNSL